MDDRDLIRRAADGDLEAFSRLVESRRERVFRIARHVVGDPELARDVTQEVFLRLFRVARRYRAGGNFDVWLHRIALNLSIDALRRERPHRDTLPLDTAAGAGGAGAPAAPTGESSTTAALRRREVRRIFAELSSKLPRRQRFAFVLREIEGLPTGEVAAILGTTESTVRNHVLQARRTLGDELRRRYPEYCRRRS
jgi:RNA polymerase sigma-70 factor (ECF subfamily)